MHVVCSHTHSTALKPLAALSILLAGLVVSSAAEPDDLYPRGQRFCFTFYSTKTADTAYALANGATAIGPYYGSQSSPLASAISFNCPIIYKVRLPCMAEWHPTNNAFVWPSEATISNEVAAIVDPVKTNGLIAMWDVEPEELRPWRTAEMNYLRIVGNVIRGRDPLERPVYMYEPNHRLASELAVSGAYQDVCGKGMYVNSTEPAFQTNRIWARWSMEQELGAVASKTSSVPWIVLWMAADPPPGTFNLITNWCRHDAYMGLIMGGKGIQIWSGFRGRAGFSDAAFQAYFDGYLTVARDLNGPLGLAPVFLFGQRQTNVTMQITGGPANLQTVFRSATHTYPSLTYLSTVLEDTNYLFVLNSSSESVTATFSNLPPAERTALFTGVVSPTIEGSFTLALGGFEVQAFRFANPAPPEPTTPPVLSIRSDSTPAEQVQISWPLDYFRYVLQGQTNPPGIGLSDDWGLVPGVISNSIAIPVDLSAGAMLFRLLKTE